MKLVRTAYALILFHTLVVAAHAAAHVHLGINGTPWQMLFVIVVIWVAPLAAAVLLRRAPRSGFAVLAASMTGAWMFGVAFHYVLPGADNVAEVHHVAWAGTFSTSALSLGVVEAVAALVGLVGYRRLSVPRVAAAGLVTDPVNSRSRPGGARRQSASTAAVHRH